jgi:hypothetical protein
MHAQKLFSKFCGVLSEQHFKLLPFPKVVFLHWRWDEDGLANRRLASREKAAMIDVPAALNTAIVLL